MHTLLRRLVIALVASTLPLGALGDGAALAIPADRSQATPHRTTEHFRFFGDEAVHPILERLAGFAEERFTRMCTPIGACERVTRPIDIWVAEDAEAFAAGFPEPSPMSEWASGVTFLAQQRVILRAHGTALLTLNETFDHELAHVLAHTYSQEGGRPLPRWFHEGLAIWLSGEGVLSRLETALKAAASGHLLTFEDLARAFPNQGKNVEIAYAQSALFVKRLVRERGPAAVVGLLSDTARGADFDEAFRARFQASPGELFETVQSDLETSSSPFLFLYDGNFLWGLVTMLFLFIAWWRIRDRKRQMARLADSEDQRIAAEDMALLAARTQAAERVELDENGRPLLH